MTNREKYQSSSIVQDLTNGLRVIPARLALARVRKGLSQSELVELLNEKLEDLGLKQIAPSTESFWECGKRPVVPKYNEALAEVLDVTVEYLIGVTNDEHGTTVELNDISIELEEIMQSELFRYHGMPVYLVFPDKSHVDGWSIYDKTKGRFLFMNFTLYDYKMTAPTRFFVATGPQTRGFTQRRSLSLQKVTHYDRVYVSMFSDDPAIRAQYNGWYHHNENKTCLINDIGLTLPYSGLNMTYIAYGDDDE